MSETRVTRTIIKRPPYPTAICPRCGGVGTLEDGWSSWSLHNLPSGDQEVIHKHRPATVCPMCNGRKKVRVGVEI